MSITLIVGASTSAPSQISGVSVVESQSAESDAAVEISWNILPCLLQNGANVSDYIIRYSPTLGGDLAARNLTATNSFNVICGAAAGGRYSCLLSRMLFHSVRSYSFQVAATNRYGVGRFSTPVYTTIRVPGKKAFPVLYTCIAL